MMKDREETNVSGNTQAARNKGMKSGRLINTIKYILANKMGKTRAKLTNNIRNRLYIKLLILERLSQKLKRKIRINVLADLRRLYSIEPKSKEIKGAIYQYVRNNNSKSYGKLQQYIENECVLVCIIGCNKRKKLLSEAIQRVLNSEFDGKVIGIIGSKRMCDWQIEFDDKSGILYLPCGDDYENLTDKITSMCLAINILNDKISIIKVDEDVKSIEAKVNVLIESMEKGKYEAAGVKIEVETILDIDRIWHIGKTRMRNIGAYQGIGTKQWLSGGAGYILKDEAVGLISEFNLHSKEYIDREIYEDLAISSILNTCERKIYWVERIDELGIHNERTMEISKTQKAKGGK